MSKTRAHAGLTKRERQIMDVLYRLGRATAAEIMEQVPGAPGYSTIRTQLRVLENKGHVRHEEQGLRYIYLPTVPRRSAGRSALRHLVDTFFDGSSAKAVAALLGGEGSGISDDELQRIAELVNNARSDLAMSVMLALAIRSSIVLLAGMLLATLLAKRSAALRHVVLAASIFAAAAVVPLSFAVPEWEVAVPRSLQSPVTTSPAPAAAVPRDHIKVGADPQALPQQRSGHTLSLAWMVWLAGFAVTAAHALDRHTPPRAHRVPCGADRRWTVGGHRPTRSLPLTDCGRGVVVLQTDVPGLARHLGPPPPSRAGACARASVARGTGARGALPRARAHPAPRLDRADHRRSAAHAALVQPADVAGVPAPAAGKRTGVRRRRAQSESLRMRMQPTCWRSPANAGGRSIRGPRRCRWLTRQPSRGELPPC